MSTANIYSESDLVAWEAAVPLTPAEPFVALLQKTITLTSMFAEGPDHSDPYQYRNTTAANYMEIRPAPGLAWNDAPDAPFRPDASAAVAVVGSLSGGSPALTRISSPYVRVRNLQMVNLGGGSSGVGACVYTWTHSDYFLIENCLLVANQPNLFGVVYLHVNQTCRNNLIVNTAASYNASGGSSGAHGVKVNDGSTSVYNNTIVRPSFVPAPATSSGVHCTFQAVNPVCANNAIFGYANGFDDGDGSGSLGAGSGRNATDLSSSAFANNMTGMGAGNLYGLPYAGQFNDAGASSSYLSTMDFRLAPASALVDAGADLTAAGVTADARGAARPRGAGFDVGAYEYPSASRRRLRNLRAGGRPVRLYS